MNWWGCYGPETTMASVGSFRQHRCLSPCEAWNCERWLQTLVGSFKYVFILFSLFRIQKDTDFKDFSMFHPQILGFLLLFFFQSQTSIRKRDHAHHFGLLAIRFLMFLVAHSPGQGGCQARCQRGRALQIFSFISQRNLGSAGHFWNIGSVAGVMKKDLEMDQNLYVFFQIGTWEGVLIAIFFWSMAVV